MYSESNIKSRLTGFTLAAIIFLVMVPPGESGLVFGQNYTAQKQTDDDGTGYFLQSGLDILPSPGSGSEMTARIYFVIGHRFTPRLSVGIGIGFTPYNDPLSLVPFFFDFNYRLNEEGISPVLFLRTGYNFSTHKDESLFLDNHSGGLLLHPGFGLEFPVSASFDLYLNTGYNIDNSSYEFESWGNRIVTNDLSFRRLSVGFGFKITP